MPDIKHTVSINASTERVFTALTNQNELSNWWSDCETDEVEGGEVKFSFEPGNFVVWRLEKLETAKLVRWHCLEHNYNGSHAFQNTDVEFHLIPEGKQCRVDFTHAGWQTEDDTFRLCTGGWAHFIKTSLKNFVETGKGEPHVVAADKIIAARV